MKTPIQELIEHFTDAWSSPSDLWKPSKVIEKIESMLEKEKQLLEDVYEDGRDYEKIEEQIDTAIDQLGQALCNADWHYNGVIEKDRVQDAMQTLMNISRTYVNLKKKKNA